jgi:polyphosphate kinase
VDAAMIEKLYDASRAGVRIQLLVRGICSLIPGVPGMSEHIEVRSLVGRYLEHGRVLIFGNNGAPLYYLSSSDWMTRNLDRRVEVTVPVREERLKKELMEQFMLQWNDPYQTRIIDATCDNRRIPQRDGLPAEDAQTRIYQRVVAQLNPHFPA